MRILILIIPILLGSCVIELVNGNDYESLSPEKQSKIKKLTEFQNLDKNFIYEITGNQLKQELNSKDKSLVYVFANGCNSDNCLPLKTIVDYAQANSLSLFLVMTSYYNIDKTLDQNVDFQFFSINNKSYAEDKSRKYVVLFKTDLGYYEYSKGEKYVGSYLFFQKDSLVNVMININE